MKIVLLIGLGSALGGMSRYAVSHWSALAWGTGFPWGTLKVNVLGSFIIGLVFYLSAPEGRWDMEPAWRQMILVGFCGGFTTFSTFSFQLLQQIREGEYGYALINVGASVLLCLLAVFLGMLAAKWVHNGLPA
ncbi:MAG: fluoride efflux transporter CrcB [Verrucomicrobiota bacterium]